MQDVLQAAHLEHRVQRTNYLLFPHHNQL